MLFSPPGIYLPSVVRGLRRITNTVWFPSVRPEHLPRANPGGPPVVKTVSSWTRSSARKKLPPLVPTLRLRTSGPPNQPAIIAPAPATWQLHKQRPPFSENDDVFPTSALFDRVFPSWAPRLACLAAAANRGWHFPRGSSRNRNPAWPSKNTLLPTYGTSSRSEIDARGPCGRRMLFSPPEYIPPR